MRWNQGRTEIDKLIADGELQRVPPNREHADQLLVQSPKDLASAELLLDSNPKRAYESLYDAARMALTAVLENEGLRPTSCGGRIAPYAGLERPRSARAGPTRSAGADHPGSFGTPLIVACGLRAAC